MCDFCLPGTGGTVRQLESATGDPVDRADVSASGCRWRTSDGAGHQYPDSDRFYRTGGTGGEKRDSDRRSGKAAGERRARHR
ncbi:hypothetical protein D3C87_1947350 [compost metagenome]